MNLYMNQVKEEDRKISVFAKRGTTTVSLFICRETYTLLVVIPAYNDFVNARRRLYKGFGELYAQNALYAVPLWLDE